MKLHRDKGGNPHETVEKLTFQPSNCRPLLRSGGILEGIADSQSRPTTRIRRFNHFFNSLSPFPLPWLRERPDTLSFAPASEGIFAQSRAFAVKNFLSIQKRRCQAIWP